jgi:hypothetical protein
MGMSRHLARRFATAGLSLGIALSSVGGVATVRAASPITDPAGVAAHFVASKVSAGGLGASSLADAVFAFAAANAGGTAAADAMDQLATKADAFMGYGATLKPGALGKVMLAVIISGGNPTSFNGHNLESDLRGLQISGGGDDGRFTGAYINDQAFAILALSATSGGVPAGAGAWLASKECTDGAYSWDGSCPVAAGTEDPDSTAIALEALLAAGDSAADKAASWLIAQQASNGSLASYGAANTTSSAAAAQALRAAGHDAEANKAAAYVASLQYGCSVAAASRGLIPWASGDAGFDGGFSSSAAGTFAFGAGRLDHLSLAGASASTPTVSCSAATAAPTGTDTTPTEPPTDTLGASTSGGSSTGGLLLLLAIFAAASSVLVVARPRHHR